MLTFQTSFALVAFFGVCPLAVADSTHTAQLAFNNSVGQDFCMDPSFAATDLAGTGEDVQDEVLSLMQKHAKLVRRTVQTRRSTTVARQGSMPTASVACVTASVACVSNSTSGSGASAGIWNWVLQLFDGGAENASASNGTSSKSEDEVSGQNDNLTSNRSAVTNWTNKAGSLDIDVARPRSSNTSNVSNTVTPIMAESTSQFTSQSIAYSATSLFHDTTVTTTTGSTLHHSAIDSTDVSLEAKVFRGDVADASARKDSDGLAMQPDLPDLDVVRTLEDDMSNLNLKDTAVIATTNTSSSTSQGIAYSSASLSGNMTATTTMGSTLHHIDTDSTDLLDSKKSAGDDEARTAKPNLPNSVDAIIKEVEEVPGLSNTIKELEEDSFNRTRDRLKSLTKSISYTTVPGTNLTLALHHTDNMGTIVTVVGGDRALDAVIPTEAEDTGKRAKQILEAMRV